MTRLRCLLVAVTLLVGGLVAVAPASAAAPMPVTGNHCRWNTAPNKVIVKVSRQHLWLCRYGKVVFHTAVTTGRLGSDTPRGTYRIQSRTRNTTLYPPSGGVYHVRYWITFDAPLYGFHDARWQTFPFGSWRWKREGSHGCVRMPVSAIATLYRWGTVGTVVRIVT